ncbi:MAG: VTT domain-containing protein, partial [Gammaproteobacteria bacterium]|nr:VTT domain-containing protein [Gammaproteobacteria bacterium]
MKRSLLILLIAALIAAFFSFDLQHTLTLEGLKGSLEQAQARLASDPLLVAGSFFIAYVIVTGLSLPGAAVMSLGGGALFGLLWGTIIVSFASSIGATLAFLVSRFVLRDAVQTRFADRLSTINEGIEKNGAFYLFTLRLVPIFPFFLINLLMGLTPIRTVTFYAVSQIGMLAATVVFINAGTQLAQLERLSDVLSPALIASFALLGIFPLLAKKVVAIIQTRRAYARWQRPAKFDRNLIVIGAGAGGLVSSYIAAAVKAKVTLVEAHKMGGDCLNTGCVPS